MSDKPEEPKKPSTDVAVRLQGVSATGVAGQIGTPRVAEGIGMAFGGASVEGHGYLTIHEQLPNDHPMYNFVGRVAAKMAAVEHLLDELIWKLLELNPPDGACVTAQYIGLRPRCLAIIALATRRRLSSDLIQRVDRFWRRAQAVADDRNRLIHDPWYLEQNTKSAAQLRAMPKDDLVYGFVPVTNGDIAKILNEIDAMNEQAKSLVESFDLALKA